MDKLFVAALKAVLESQRPRAGPRTAALSTVSQPQPSVPYAAGTVPAVTPTTTTSNTHDGRTPKERYHQDVSYGQDCH